MFDIVELLQASVTQTADRLDSLGEIDRLDPGA
jgi:hypothetical protein